MIASVNQVVAAAGKREVSVGSWDQHWRVLLG